jgi:hypothetical protein
LVRALFIFIPLKKKLADVNFLRKFSPWVILNDLGGAFVMGAVGGGIWHSVKGAKNSPKVLC